MTKFSDLSTGAKTVADLQDYVARDAGHFPKEAFRLSFTSNHDENSWQGTEFERMGACANAGAVLCFTLPGSQPLIYTGQEIGLHRRLAFFEKDPITDWSANQYTAFWKKLVDLKHQNPALAAGERGGALEWIKGAPAGIVAYKRSIKRNSVVVYANFGTTDVTAHIKDLRKAFVNFFTGEPVRAGTSFTLKRGEFVVLTYNAL